MKYISILMLLCSCSWFLNNEDVTVEFKNKKTGYDYKFEAEGEIIK